MENSIENTVSVLDLGKSAMRLFKSADTNNGRGEAVASYALWLAAHQNIFTARVIEKGKETETFSFDLWEAVIDHPSYVIPRKADGSTDGLKVRARNRAIALEVFGIDELSSNDKTRINRCLRLIASFAAKNLPFEAVSLSSANELIVPYHIAMPPLSKKESEDETKVETRFAMHDKPTKITGTEGRSINAMLQRAYPPKAKGADERNTTDKIVSFVNSVKFIGAVIVARNDESGENNAADDIPAFSGAIKSDLWNLYQSLGAYFESDPIEDNGEIEAPRTGTEG